MTAKQLKTQAACLIGALALAMAGGPPAAAAAFPGYTYNSWGTGEPAPNGYSVSDVLRTPAGSNVAFSAPADLYVRDGLLYVLDAGNRRVVVLDGNLRLSKIIDRLTDPSGKPYALSEPSGLFVTKDGRLVIADTGNACVVVADGSGRIRQILKKPDSAQFAKEITFAPVKAVVDNQDNIYVLSKGFYYGAVVYNAQGRFTGYFGANRVGLTAAQLADLFWRRFMTKKQISYMARYVPIAYNSLDIDGKGFIYTCTGTTDDSTNELKKLNYMGNNVLQSQSGINPSDKSDYGDKEKAVVDGKTYDTNFVDISISPDGFISALDAQRGRVFLYDQNSNLVTAFGELGTQKGTFGNPVAVQETGGRVLVLDKAKNSITVFAPTEYGSLLRCAVTLYSQGLYQQDRQVWEQVLRLNANCELAYRGIGRAYLQQGLYKQAMEYLRKGQDREGYSEAFRHQRTADARKVFPFAVTAVIALIVYLLWRKSIHRAVRRLLKLPGPANTEKRPGPMSVFAHPLAFYDSLFDDRRRKTLVESVIAVGFMILAKTMEHQTTGFIFNTADLSRFNVLPVITQSFGLVLLWSVSDWMIGSLRFGEGTFRKIWMGTAFATLPYTVSVFVRILLSNVLTQEEAGILTLVSAIGFLLSGWLLFNSVRAMQQYSVSGAAASLVFDAAAATVVLFVLVLVVSLLREFLMFVGTVYSELAFRA